MLVKGIALHTKSSELTRYIFRSEDDPILDYLDDDGTFVEPISLRSNHSNDSSQWI